MQTDSPLKLKKEHCPECWYPQPRCLCGKLQKNLQNQNHIFLLQHPQGIQNPFSTARLLSLSLKNGMHRIGLSFRSQFHAFPVLNAQLKSAVLFVGSKSKYEDLLKNKPFLLLDPKQRTAPKSSLNEIKQWIVLDGNWRQSKALWWRNSWLKKGYQIILNPAEKARYHQIYREPRHEYLSTLESVSYLFSLLNEKDEIVNGLSSNLSNLLDAAKS